MKRLLLCALALAGLPALAQAELPGQCVPGCAPKRACAPQSGPCLTPRQLCPQTCAPNQTGCTPQKRCLIKESLGRLHSSCPLKRPSCDTVKSCLPRLRTPGCLSRFKDGACRLITSPVKSACKSVCRLGRPTCSTDPCCGIDRIVIHTQPCCQPSPCGQVMIPRQPCVVPQTCCPQRTCQVTQQSGMMVVPTAASASNQQLEQRLTRLEAEVSSLVRQVERQNGLIQRR